MDDIRCAIIVDPDLPLGVIANTAAVLAMSLGKRHPELVGQDLPDARGQPRTGITTVPMPVLKAGADQLRALRAAACKAELTLVELASATRATRSYQEYAAALASTPEEEIQYQGLALCGPGKRVRQLTGSLGLLR
ncbi:DUF2000 domain-containing protein [Chromobacterium piscinae]|uniref:DUF2000 domain-containing protein n=1 Tax=Chromobacterium piscinae TaxID=686831 RepID=A0ABV0H876_9NEIS|nr:DUF2000 domain-containing protein [Chromobacterium piscinae]MBX9295637.1 DUF2000 domain-containing protein [Chromobacterium vaccinii]MBX9355390.1 DUF2000 domain-containing protein [Chromobacterium vaccinii]MCD5327142.1 DUF2000 domain-containing protein [Chromobacterium piscinae]NHQ83795.1 DUF2000 domain-containing protein [Chromobacterium vaccinii]